MGPVRHARVEAARHEGEVRVGVGRLQIALLVAQLRPGLELVVPVAGPLGEQAPEELDVRADAVRLAEVAAATPWRRYPAVRAGPAGGPAAPTRSRGCGAGLPSTRSRPPRAGLEQHGCAERMARRVVPFRRLGVDEPVLQPHGAIEVGDRLVELLAGRGDLARQHFGPDGEDCGHRVRREERLIERLVAQDAPQAGQLALGLIDLALRHERKAAHVVPHALEKRLARGVPARAASRPSARSA
jgi:hypothetical protein